MMPRVARLGVTALEPGRVVMGTPCLWVRVPARLAPYRRWTRDKYAGYRVPAGSNPGARLTDDFDHSVPELPWGRGWESSL